jgi:acyl-CoA synthetase (AMP-forming)/AMP-acid ligase II
LDYEELTAKASEEEPAIGATEDDLLFIMYTSGTTGLPKGTMQTHNTMLWAQFTSMTTSDMRADDRFLLSLPMFHVGCLLPVSQLVHSGATGIVMRQIDFGVMLQTIQDEKVSIFMSVPALLQFMLLFPEREKYDLSSVRWITTGAAPVPLSLIRDYKKLGIDIYQAYGLTEACGPGSLLSAQHAETKLGSAGGPLMHTELKVVDEEGKEIPHGSDQVGELLLRAKHIMLGYWNNPTATAEALRDGWLHTGDLCTIDEDGCITICDRKKDLIISGGENIYPAEIEKVLADCPEVGEVGVIGMPSEKWGEVPAAIVVAADGASPTAESLESFCRSRLAGYKTPKVFELVEAIPRNPSGKILKHELRKRFPGPARA